MLIGYMRVSKADGSQVLDLQRDALLVAGVEREQIYEDLASGRRDDRPGLAACLKSLRPDDTLVVWKLDRLGRDLRHLVNLVHDLSERGIGLKVLTGDGAAIDTTTAAGKLVFGIFAALAEFERELIAERTRTGLAAANFPGFSTQTARRAEVATTALSLPRKLLGEDVIIHTRRPPSWVGLSQEDAALLDFLRPAGKTSELSPVETAQKTLALFKAQERFERLARIADTEPAARLRDDGCNRRRAGTRI